MKKQRKGKIINISSGTVLGGTPMFLHYAITPGLTIADESQKKMLSEEYLAPRLQARAAIF
jgi:hypothetical protein